MVEKFESVEWDLGPRDRSHGSIRLHPNDTYSPHLINTEHCDYITVYWDCEASEHEKSVIIYAVTDGHFSDEDKYTKEVETWYDFELLEALAYVADEFV